MTFDTFVSEQIKALNRFKDYWEKSHEKNPAFFPKEMNSGDWDEQLSFFIENGDQ